MLNTLLIATKNLQLPSYPFTDFLCLVDFHGLNELNEDDSPWASKFLQNFFAKFCFPVANTRMWEKFTDLAFKTSTQKIEIKPVEFLYI